MKTINFIEKNSTNYYFETTDGRCFAPTWAWDAKYDLEGGAYYTPADAEWDEVDFPTLTELVYTLRQVREVAQEYRVSRPDWTHSHELTSDDIDGIADEFAKHGLRVTDEAIIHNFNAWRADYKSGYRGEDFFLFTPCGCNALQFRAEGLIDGCDYQKTYEA